jgi:hypothetical protein
MNRHAAWNVLETRIVSLFVFFRVFFLPSSYIRTYLLVAGDLRGKLPHNPTFVVQRWQDAQYECEVYDFSDVVTAWFARSATFCDELRVCDERVSPGCLFVCCHSLGSVTKYSRTSVSAALPHWVKAL